MFGALAFRGVGFHGCNDFIQGDLLPQLRQDVLFQRCHVHVFFGVVPPHMHNTMDHDILVHMKERIEAMNSTHHVELAALLSAHNVPFNQNNNGKFYNISLVTPDIVSILDNFIKHVDLQEENLVKIEREKDALKDSYFK